MQKTLILALVLMAALAAFAQVPPKIDFSKFPAEAILIEEVVVPVPSEVFRVLDKLGKPKWSAVQHSVSGVAQPFGEPPQIALVLGVILAEGFIAVEAEDANEVQQIGKSVLHLARAVGVEKAVIKRSKSIIDHAGDKAWTAVRRELDGALKDVKKAMLEANSQSLAQLVSLGGWLRGTDALAAVVAMDFTPESAELLGQPLLLEHFDQRLGSLSPKEKANVVVPKIHEGLLKLRPLIRPAEGAIITEKSVQEIHAITAELIKIIRARAG